jgi:hypothetical protein
MGKALRSRVKLLVKRSVCSIRILSLLFSAGLLAGVFAFYLPFFAAHAWMLLTHPYPLDYGEGPLLGQVDLLRNGVPIWQLYSNPDTPPYAVVNYPPLYPLLSAALAQLIGNTLLAGRLLSLFAALGSVGALALLTLVARPRSPSPLTHHPSPATHHLPPVFALLFLTIPVAREWGAFMRVDMLGVCLGLWGLVALQRRHIALTALLFLLSLYTKPSLIAAPLAGCAWVVLAALHEWRDGGSKSGTTWRRAVLTLFVLLGIGGGGLFLLLQSASDGWFALHVVAANANRWQSDLAAQFWFDQARLRWPLMLAALLALAAHLRSPPPALLLPLFYTLAGALVAAGVGKVGAYANYFLEFYAGLVWLVCLGQPAARPSREPHPLAPVILLLLLASLAYYSPTWSKTTLHRAGLVEPDPPRLAVGRYALWDDLAREAEVLAALERVHSAVAEEVRTAGPLIFTDVPGTATGAGDISRVQIFEHRQLLDQGIWDQRALLLELANGELPLAVVDYLGNWMTPQMIDMLRHRYAHDKISGMYELYRPVAPGPRFSSDLLLNETMHLSGYHLVPPVVGEGTYNTPYTAGELLVVTLELQTTPSNTSDAVSAESSPLIVELHLTDEAGRTLQKNSRPLLYGALPPADWPADTPVQHMQPFRLPPDLPTGRYGLALALHTADGRHAEPRQVASIAVAAGSEQGGRIFETGYFVPSSFLLAWEKMGGVARMGLPLMPAVPFAWGRLQCFEFACLEQRGNAAVTLRPLGEQFYLAETLRSTSCITGSAHSSSSPPLAPPLCAGFAQAWHRYGGEESLGAPISGEVPRNGYIVQWTRYARLERLPEGSTVGLGRLGAEALALPPGVRYAWPGAGESGE